MMAAEPSSAAASAAEYLEILPLDSSYSSALATDPFLRPPSSPSSIATDGSHDPFGTDDFVDDDDVAPAPSTLAPATAGTGPAEAPAPVFARIAVSDPKKHADTTAGAAGVIPGSGSYFSYLITTRLADGGGEVRVRRRFRDVVALADRLAAAHRGLFVPTRPDKSIVEGQVMQRHDFVCERCNALQRYLRRLAAHPVVGHSPDLRTFLTEPGAISAFEDEAPRYWTTTVNSAAPSAPTKTGGDLFGMFKGLKETAMNFMVATKPPLVVDTDTEFLVHKYRLQDLQQQLTTTSQQAEALVKARDDLKTTMAHLGTALIKLAKFEREQGTCSPQRRRAADINNFAKSIVKFSRSQTKLNSEIVKHLGSIHEHLEMMLYVHHAFSDRSHALQHVQTLSADLFFLHTRARKFESVSSRGIGQEWSRYQKREGLKETISAAEAAKSRAVREYETIKVNQVPSRKLRELEYMK
ncbi:hypothetical protein GUJ93_ZPchr0010g7777 [Zizania palustris]|uniref:PX domain-containing protein n=1 Tax=Zizania palustris TaxID=103762 RepID=A0A8J5WB03_ZIZPA|nr:hypothetical protein GUJ93_ZPchr0010g7777 [Zizania palustris]